MNFSAVHGFNAYKQFTVKVRESVKLQEARQEQGVKNEKSGSLFSDPVDTVSISRTALSRFQSLSGSQINTKAQETESLQTTLNEWIKTSGNNPTAAGRVQNRASGQTISELLKLSGVPLEENEVYSIDMDVWCAVSVTEKNAEKARAIQNLLNTTPSGINWGFLLQKLPPDR